MGEQGGRPTSSLVTAANEPQGLRERQGERERGFCTGENITFNFIRAGRGRL